MGNYIPSGSYIELVDIGTTKHRALSCRSERNNSIGNWYLHPTQVSTDDGDRIISDRYGNTKGWHRERKLSNKENTVRLWRDSSSTVEEGVFTCCFTHNRSMTVFVHIHYPSESFYYNRS